MSAKTENKKEAKIEELEKEYEKTIEFWELNIKRTCKRGNWIVGDEIVEIPCDTVEDIEEELKRSRRLMVEELEED